MFKRAYEIRNSEVHGKGSRRSPGDNKQIAALKTSVLAQFLLDREPEQDQKTLLKTIESYVTVSVVFHREQ